MPTLYPHPNPLPKGEGNHGNKLLLVDGNAILHRAFHAYPGFTDKEGKIVNAIYGFYAMLLKLLEEVRPAYLSVCWDRGAPTFRMNMYAGYHANRPKMQDDLALQVPRLQESLEKLGIPQYGVEGYEADDLLGTLSVLARTKDLKENNLEVVIVTGDRDLLQLVNAHVKLLMPITGITKSVVMGEKEVQEKYGVTPHQFIDYKALVGDQSDNYPGVTGIGPKTAAGLLQKYQTLENLYQQIGNIKPELAEKLARDAEQCALAKLLATIHTDAPIHLDLEHGEVSRFPKEKFIEIFEEFGFNSLIKRIGKDPSTSLRAMATTDEKKTKDNPQMELL